MRRALWLVVTAALSACPERKGSVDENDPLIRKLKAEQERLAKGGAPGGPQGLSPLKEPPQPLAEVALQPPDMPVPLAVKEGAVTADGVTVEPRRLETAQTISGPKVKLSTTERFVRLVVTVSTTTERSFNLAKATLTRGAEVYELARDVQRVGQGSPLVATVGPGVSQDLVLYFEVPPAAVSGPLRLVLPSTGAPLEVPIL